MRKVLYFVLSILSLIYIGLVCFLSLNGIYNWMDMSGEKLLAFAKSVDMVIKFGPVALLGGFCLVNFFGKTLKIIFLLILIALIVLYILIFATNVFIPAI